MPFTALTDWIRSYRIAFDLSRYSHIRSDQIRSANMHHITDTDVSARVPSHLNDCSSAAGLSPTFGPFLLLLLFTSSTPSSLFFFELASLLSDVLVRLRLLARLEAELLFREYKNYPGERKMGERKNEGRMRG